MDLLGARRGSQHAAGLRGSTTRLERGCVHGRLRRCCLQPHRRELDVPRYSTRDPLPLPWRLAQEMGGGRNRRRPLLVWSHRPITRSIRRGTGGGGTHRSTERAKNPRTGRGARCRPPTMFGSGGVALAGGAETSRVGRPTWRRSPPLIGRRSQQLKNVTAAECVAS